MSTLSLNNILPYVYKLIHKETGQFYIGYRRANKVPSEVDILEYKSSSKKVKELGFENFNIEILVEFFAWEDAYEFEQNLIKENFKDPLILNRNYNTNNVSKFNTSSVKKLGKDNNFYGKNHTEETKYNLGRARVGSNNPMAKRVLVNGQVYVTIKDAATYLKYDAGDLCNILKGKRNLNNKIWQAEYF